MVNKFSLLIVGFLAGTLSGLGLLAQTATQSGMGGKLVAVHDHSISVRNDEVTRTFQINKETKIWRGHDTDLHQLHVGDDIAIQYRLSSNGEAFAVSIWANTDRWAGTITKVFGERVQIARMDDHGDPDGNVVIIFDGATIFTQGARKDLEIGRFLEVTGLVLRKDQMQAARVLHVGPN